jgi:hypothetical protein
MTKRKETVDLHREKPNKGKAPTAERGPSSSGLLARQTETLVGQEEAYERSAQQAALLLDQGFHLGGVIHSSRDEWHDR